jgi:hypothetical protein
VKAFGSEKEVKSDEKGWLTDYQKVFLLSLL